MPAGYDSHADYMGWVKEAAHARAAEMRASMVRAFSAFVEVREVEVINFSAMTAMDLAAAIQAEPSILKPLMACCNVAEPKPAIIDRRRYVASSRAMVRS